MAKKKFTDYLNQAVPEDNGTILFQNAAANNSYNTTYLQLITDLTNKVGPLVYQGTWNANTNTPVLVSGTGSKGLVYVVSVSGNTNLDGITDWKETDWVAFNGTVWEKIDNTDQVVSVFGRQGAVVAGSGDYTASQITNVPIGDIVSANVQDAINEMQTQIDALKQKTFAFTSETTVVLNHNLGYKPIFNIINASDQVITGIDAVHTTNNTLTINFNQQETGIILYQ